MISHLTLLKTTFSFNIYTNQSTKLIVVPSVSNNLAVIHKKTSRKYDISISHSTKEKTKTYLLV